MAGADNDVITLTGGKNNVKAGAGDDRITIGAGINVVDGGAGKDTFIFNAGVGAGANDATTVNGGAGDDTYDASAVVMNADMVSIVDTKGDNKLILGAKHNVFFDVTVDKKGNFKTMGSELMFTTGNTFATATNGVSYTTGLKKVKQLYQKLK